LLLRLQQCWGGLLGAPDNLKMEVSKATAPSGTAGRSDTLTAGAVKPLALACPVLRLKNQNGLGGGNVTYKCVFLPASCLRAIGIAQACLFSRVSRR